jgi:phage FluMu protein Com
MKTEKKLIIILGVLTFVTVLVFLLIKVKENQFLKKADGTMVYFFGKGCPHCAVVNKFFKENEIEKKFQFEKREVFYNETNKRLLILLAKEKCNLKKEEIGVPFFWDGFECFIGEGSIINFFERKLKL